MAKGCCASAYLIALSKSSTFTGYVARRVASSDNFSTGKCFRFSFYFFGVVSVINRDRIGLMASVSNHLFSYLYIEKTYFLFWRRVFRARWSGSNLQGEFVTVSELIFGRWTSPVRPSCPALFFFFHWSDGQKRLMYVKEQLDTSRIVDVVQRDTANSFTTSSTLFYFFYY